VLRRLAFAIAIAVPMSALIFLAPLDLHHTPDSEEDLGDLSSWMAGPPIHPMSDAELDQLLRQLDQANIPPLDRLRILALRRVGTPYERDCLGEEAGEDPDPLFRVDSTDCTVFILTQAALAHASSVTEARRNMEKANYREVNGANPTTYSNRLHFTIDRIHASPYFRDITRDVAGDTFLKDATVLLNRKADGSPLLPIPWEREVTVSYVPAEKIDSMLLDRLPPIAGAALIKEKHFAIGVVTAHEGMILDGRDFVHGSSTAGEVVRVPFLDYLFPDGDEPLFDGVVFYEFR
jgi:hypothetical protein